MKTILLWDPRFPEHKPARLSVDDTVASAAVRSGVACAANPADAGALSAGGQLDGSMITEVVIQHGSAGAMRRVFLPYSVVLIGAMAGVLASIGVPIPSVVTPPPVPSQIGGLAVGAEGAGYAATYFLAAGKDYADGLAELITPANPRGRFAATRGTYLIAAQGQSPKGSDGLAAYDAVPGETGWNDANRGVPVATFADMIAVIDGRLRLRQRALAAGEAALIDKPRPVVGAMVHTAGAFFTMAPGIVEWREQRNAYARSHMTGWLINNFFSTDLIEYDIESSNKSDGTGNGVQLGFNVNDWNAGVQTATEISAAQSPSQAAEHTYAFKMFLNGDVQAFMNGTSLGLVSGYRAKTLARAFHALFTNHAYAAGVTSGDPTADYFVRWIRFYRYGTGNSYRPLTAGADYTTAFNTPFSFTLPDQATVWGTTGKTEVVKAIMVEPNEPGGATSGQVYGSFPAGISYNPATRELSGTVGDKAGRLHIFRWIEEAGSVCEPQHIILNVGPNIRVGDLNFANGSTVNFDLYALCDCGVLVTDGASRTKIITVSGIAGSGLSYSDATGMLTGTAANNFAGTMTINVTNSIGQTATKTVPLVTKVAVAYESWNGPGWFDASDSASVSTSGSAVTGVKNKRTSGGDLQPLGSAGWTYVAAAQNGKAAIRLARNVAAKANVPRLSASGSNVPISQQFQGDDKPYLVITVFKPTDTNTGYVWAASKATGTSADAETVALVRRSGTPSSIRRGNVTATSNDVTFGAGAASGAARIVASRFNGATIDIWDNSASKSVVAAPQDAAAFTSGLVFRLGATEAPDGTGGGNFAVVQSNTDYFEIIIEATRTDAEIAQAITDLAAKWGITLS